jgi:hypothetical protein
MKVEYGHKQTGITPNQSNQCESLFPLMLGEVHSNRNTALIGEKVIGRYTSKNSDRQHSLKYQSHARLHFDRGLASAVRQARHSQTETTLSWHSCRLTGNIMVLKILRISENETMKS